MTGLEKLEYLKVRKRFVGKKINTGYKVSRTGKRVFQDHISALEELITFIVLVIFNVTYILRGQLNFKQNKFVRSPLVLAVPESFDACNHLDQNHKYTEFMV